MKIEPLTENCYGDYSLFLDEHIKLGFTYSISYKKLLEELLTGECCTILVRSPKGSIQGILPMFVMDGPYGLVYNSQPFFGSYGGIHAINDEAKSLLVAEWNERATKSGVCSATIIENPLENNVKETRFFYNTLDRRIGQLTDLTECFGGSEKLWSMLHVKTRNAVRKAQKQGFRVSYETEEWGFLEEKHKEGMKRIGGAIKPERFFQLVPKHFSNGEDFKIWTAYKDGEPVSSLLLFYWGNSVEYFLPVVDHKYRSSQSLSCLIFEAMEDAIERGFYLWNWGGTWLSQEGVYRFKSRWGATDYEYHYFTQLNNFELKEIDHEKATSLYPNYFLYPFRNQISID